MGFHRSAILTLIFHIIVEEWSMRRVIAKELSLSCLYKMTIFKGSLSAVGIDSYVICS